VYPGSLAVFKQAAVYFAPDRKNNRQPRLAGKTPDKEPFIRMEVIHPQFGYVNIFAVPFQGFKIPGKGSSGQAKANFNHGT
jgi:hypothetical protein